MALFPTILPSILTPKLIDSYETDDTQVGPKAAGAVRSRVDAADCNFSTHAAASCIGTIWSSQEREAWTFHS